MNRQLFTIHLNELEDKLLRHVVAEPNDWIQNLIEWRVRIAQDEYLPRAIEQLKASGVTAIPATRDEIILASNLPPKDPNWTPYGRHVDNECVEYSFTLEDDDIKMLAYMYENPHKHIADWITDRVELALKEKVDTITKELIADPTWKDPIPTDPVELLNLVNLKTVKDLMEESSKSMMELTAKSLTGEMDAYVPPAPVAMTYKHHEDKGPPAPGNLT